MMLSRILTFSLFAAGAVLTAQAGAAQSDLTADEIKDAFEKQKTRGLVIVPSGETSSETKEEAQLAAQTYNEVERADQVNIKINFDFDSASLREDEKPKLAALCDAMQLVDVAVFQIIGHTDSSGSEAYNENLSLLRAKEVKRHLVTNCGISDERLTAIGMGETAPFDSDDTRSDVNRRVEFQALG